jgi:hypothetical protein
LNALETQRAEILAQWKAASVFVGQNTAEVVRGVELLEEEGPTEAVPLTHRGYFQGFGRLASGGASAFSMSSPMRTLSARVAIILKGIGNSITFLW